MSIFSKALNADKLKVVMMAYGSVVPALVSMVMQLYVFNATDISSANTYFTGLAVVVGGAGVLACNSNYVLLTRFPTISKSLQNFECQQIFIFRTVTYLALIIPILLLVFEWKVSAWLAVLGLVKITQESVLNYYRANSDQLQLLKYSLLYGASEALFVMGSLFFSIYIFLVDPWIVVVVAGFISLGISCFHSRVFTIVLSARGNYREFYSIYIRGCTPLIFSSVRENLIGSGMIVAGAAILSEARFAEFNILSRLYRLVTIIFSALANFYAQDMAREKENKDVLLVIFVVSIVVSASLFIAVNSFSNLFDLNVTFSPFLQMGIIAGVLVQGMYYVTQVRLVIGQESLKLITFEVSTSLFLCLFFYLGSLDVLFLMYSVVFAHIIGFLMLTAGQFFSWRRK